MFTFLRTETHEQKYKVRLSAKTTNMHELNSNWNSKFHKKKGKIFRAMDISGDEITLKVAVRDTYTTEEIQIAITTLGLSDLTIKEEDLNYGAFEGEKNGLTKDQFDSFKVAFSAVTDNLTKQNQTKIATVESENSDATPINPLKLEQNKDSVPLNNNDQTKQKQNPSSSQPNYSPTSAPVPLSNSLIKVPVSSYESSTNLTLNLDYTLSIATSPPVMLFDNENNKLNNIENQKNSLPTNELQSVGNIEETDSAGIAVIHQTPNTSQVAASQTQLNVGFTDTPKATENPALQSITSIGKKAPDGMADKVAIDQFNQRMASLSQTKKMYENYLKQEQDKLSKTKQEIARLKEQQYKAVTAQDELKKLQKEIDDNNVILNSTQQELSVNQAKSLELATSIQDLKTSLNEKEQKKASIQNKALVIVSPDGSEKAGTIPLPDGHGSVASDEMMTKAQNNHQINTETTDLLAQLQEKLTNKTTEVTALKTDLTQKQQLHKQAADEYNKYPAIYAFFESIGVFFRRLFGSAATTRKDKLREQLVEHKKQIDQIEKKLKESEQTIVAITADMKTLQSINRDIEQISTQLKSASHEQTIIQGTIATLEKKETTAKTFSTEKQQELKKRSSEYLAMHLSDSEIQSLRTEQQRCETMVKDYENLLNPYRVLQEDDYAILESSTKEDILCQKVAKLTPVETACALQKYAILHEASSSEKSHQLPSTNQSQLSNSRPPQPPPPPPRKTPHNGNLQTNDEKSTDEKSTDNVEEKKSAEASSCKAQLDKKLSPERPNFFSGVLQAIKEKEEKTNQTQKPNSVVKLNIVCDELMFDTISKEELQKTKKSELNKGIPGSDALHIAYIFFYKDQAYYTHDRMDGPELLDELHSTEFKKLKKHANIFTANNLEINQIKAFLSDYIKTLFDGDVFVQTTINSSKKQQEEITLQSMLRSAIQTRGVDINKGVDTKSESDSDSDSEWSSSDEDNQMSNKRL